jgi:protein-disulfide isomerase
MTDQPLPPPQDPAAADKRRRPLEFARWLALLVPLAFAAGLGLGFLLWGQAEEVEPVAAQPGEFRRYEVSVDDDPAIGPEDAPVTIIEFSDFNCPFCRKWHEQTLLTLLAAYPDQIRFVYRDLPVVGGGTVGSEAAQAADCAGDQGKYWEFHNLLFVGTYGLSQQAYLQYASDLGLDGQALAECLETNYHAGEVQADLEEALQLGVNSTPTFFVNGIPVVGAQPAQIFQQIIDMELQG